MAAEHRSRSRVSTHRDAILQVGEVEMPVRTVNVSLKGILTEPRVALNLGQDCAVLIPLSDEARIEAFGRVVRADARGQAVAFTAVDAEGYPHLHRLVQLNAEDADRIDREVFDIPDGAG